MLPQNLASTRQAIHRRLPVALGIQAFAWVESFVLVPLQIFWVLSANSPLVAENRTSILLAAVPFGVVALAGVAARWPAAHMRLLRIEWLLHWTSAACTTGLVAYTTLRDPFAPGVPITWPLCFWSVCISFTLLSNLALHERLRLGPMPAQVPVAWLMAATAALVVWAACVWLASVATWQPYLWTTSIVFHALVARVSRRAIDGEPVWASPRGRLARTVPLVEAFFAIGLMLPALMRLVYAGDPAGTAELRYLEFVNAFVGGAFLAGAALALAAYRVGLRFATHALVAALAIGYPESDTWPISPLLGYGLAVLFLASMRQGAMAYCLTLVAATGMWLLGLLGFTLAGLVVLLGAGDAFAKGWITHGPMLVMGLYVLWLVLAMLDWRGPKSSGEPIRPEPLRPRLSTCMAYAAAWTAVLVPVTCLWAVAMRPAVVLDRPAQIVVGEVSGLCHVGYSKSEEEYAELAALGAHLTRLPIAWNQVQPKPGIWDFSTPDALLDAAEKHGMKIIFVLAFDNNAVEKSPEGAARNVYVAPEDLPLYLEYVKRVVRRYKGRVYVWEIWNEPDIPQFWGGTMKEFYTLARRTAETVREVDPSARILGSAVTSLVGVYGVDGIDGLYASGAMVEVNHPSIHTYISNPRGYYHEFLRARNAAAKYGHPGSVWITELGITDGGLYPWRVSRDRGAEHVVKAYAIATAMGVERLMWHCHKDAPLEAKRETPRNSEHYFGLADAEGQWKPAAHAYCLFARHCNHSVIRNDLVHVSGGLAARQTRSVLYRRADGSSALILWFEPALRPGAHARVALDLGPLDTPAMLHDIGSGDRKPLLDPVVDLTEEPLFVTYKAPALDTPVSLVASTSSADTAWLTLLAALVVVGAIRWR